MNYANAIKNDWNKIKNLVNENRKKHYLTPLTLESRINDCYIEYKKFCLRCGTPIKTKSEFLRSEVI